MNKYIVIPGCSDLNRGDQALAWKTKEFAESAGFKGNFFLTAEKNEPTSQSIGEGFKVIEPLLEHPSRKFSNNHNINYTLFLKLKWGMVAFIDFLKSVFLLNNFTRKIAMFFLNSEKKEAVKEFSSSDGIFMKGGGLLQTYGGVTSTYSMYFWVFPILLANSLNIPVYIFPNSFGPFKGPFVKFLARKALNNCKLVTVRESYSKKKLKENLNINSKLIPDLAFDLEPSSLKKESIQKRFDLKTDRKWVALTMRPYRFPNAKNSEEKYESFKEELAIFIQWLYDKGFMPVLVEHTLAINDHENDGKCIKEVTQKLDSNSYRIISDNSFDCRDLKKIYSFCDYIVGTRFHSIIFSFGNETPGIAISYTGNKAVGIMHDIGLAEYVINIDDVKSNRLEKMFVDLEKNKNNVIRKIQKYNKESNLQMENFLRILKETNS